MMPPPHARSLVEQENKIKGAVIMADSKLVSAADLGLLDAEEEPVSVNLREVRQRAESKAIRSTAFPGRWSVS